MQIDICHSNVPMANALNSTLPNIPNYISIRSWPLDFWNRARKVSERGKRTIKIPESVMDFRTSPLEVLMMRMAKKCIYLLAFVL